MRQNMRNRSLLLLALSAPLAGVALAQPEMPPGHPPLPQEQQSLSSSTDDVMKRMMMEGARGSLAVTVVQGTKGAPPVGELDLRVDLYHQNSPIYEMHAGTDASGAAMIGDLPVAIEVRPVVRAEYGGVSYLEIGPRMDAASPDAVVKLTVYETTEETPDWRVVTRHLMASRVPEGLVVEETVIVENPVDQTWLGTDLNEENQGTTVRVALPEQAQEVELIAGFHGWCCTAIDGRQLQVKMPLMPGQSTFKFAYFVPAAEEAVDLTVSAPVPTDNMVLFLPDDGSTAEPASLALAGAENFGPSRMRFYQGQAIGGGAEAGVRLASLQRAPEPGQSAPAGGGNGLKIAAIIGGSVAALLGFAVILRRKAGA